MTSSSPENGPKPQITIETPRLVLRGAHLSDVQDLFECFRDEEAMRYWDTLPHADSEVTKGWVEKMIAGPNHGSKDFVICLKPTTESQQQEIKDPGALESENGPSTIIHSERPMKVIGKAGIWHDNEIGFLLNRSYWGKGFGVEVLREILDLAFQPLFEQALQTAGHELKDGDEPCEDVVADVDPRNTASLGILGKLGFEVYETKERTFKVGGQWVDSVYLRLNRKVWLSRREELSTGSKQ